MPPQGSYCRFTVSLSHDLHPRVRRRYASCVLSVSLEPAGMLMTYITGGNTSEKAITETCYCAILIKTVSDAALLDRYLKPLAISFSYHELGQAWGFLGGDKNLISTTPGHVFSGFLR
jgi:hypothetical protein